MRKMVVFLFLFVYLFSATELSELLKVNMLFEHFSEHQVENKNISISAFLYMHYVSHGKDNGDTKKDDNLPFHSDSESSNSVISSITIPPTNIAVPFNLPAIIHEKRNFYAINLSLKSSYLASIWQPPQIV